jgi:hypothetical protein
LGIVTTASKKTKISRSTYYDWMKNDPEFKKKVEGVDEVAKDYVESKLFSQITDGNTSATIFYLKCKGASRGYVEKSEVTSTNLNVNTEMDDEEKQKAIDKIAKASNEFADYEE